MQKAGLKKGKIKLIINFSAVLSAIRGERDNLMKKINCHLKGSTYCDGQHVLRSIVSDGRTIRPADLYLARDYNCEQDRNCVQVNYRNDGMDVKIGNVNKENAPLIATCMDKGGTATIISATLYGNVDQGQNVGMYFWVKTVSR